jgi:hypothetical protein
LRFNKSRRAECRDDAFFGFGADACSGAGRKVGGGGSDRRVAALGSAAALGNKLT